ncbi:DUF6414 family protein [Bacillus sp. SD088]|uniref:DUF6414 family protein n=1 Tax=Bacillus sp. SD088 TaxID=2782012 RepID=UPI001A95769C|nr:hypothetical protein [Bacillus sp. SD088]MBO0992591.1 hypothetical protein [Bacillus sp. SD088]
MKLKMPFRDFYYLDSEYVDNLLGIVEGFIQEEYSEVKREERTNQGKGKFALADIGRESRKGEETVRTGRVSAELKYNKLFDYLVDKGLEQIDAFDETLWDMILDEEEILELRGALHFTQIYNLEKTTQYLGGFMRGLDMVQDSEIDMVAGQASKIRHLQEKNGIPIRLVTSDGQYTFIAYLNERYLQKQQNEIMGNDYKMLCKVERVIERGEDYNIFDPKEIEHTILNREQRRQNKKLPDEFMEKVKGPAAVVLPIAIYR